MSENQSQPILNPNIYLNYLQPGIATQYEVTRDIFLATLGVRNPCPTGTMIDMAVGSIMGYPFQPTRRLETHSNNQTFYSAICLLCIQVFRF